MRHFIVTIEGPGWTDLDEVELPDLPREGEPIETKFGTCLVTHAELQASTEQHDGKIVCRLP
ncbi:MAG TPA: hypothetical protein VLA87_01000 [Gaiellaceae bacterium]|nr:hypothetical protein [Gaiellaceae bacterium]